MANERVLQPSEEEYKNLEYACELMSATSKNNYDYEVEDVYLDYGQKWMWTTITCYDDDRNSWQVLSPKDWKVITEAETLEEIDQYVLNEMKNDKFWLDK